MADQKITQLSEDTNPQPTDLLVTVDDPGGTPANKKATLSNVIKSINAETANTTPAASDIIPIIDDPAGTPDVQKITITNLLKAVSGLTANTTPAAADELLIMDDVAGTLAAQKVTLTNFFKVINDLTADATPDKAADYVVTYDASGTAAKKVLVSAVSGDRFSALLNAEVSITGAATATIGKMHVCSGTANYSVVLPATSGNAGKMMGFRFTNTAITTIDPNASETIDGVTTRAFYEGQTEYIITDGSNWLSLENITTDRGYTISPLRMIHSKAQSYIYNAGQFNLYYSYQTSPANGDTYTFSIWLSKGSYTLSVAGATLTSTGILDWTIDGVSATTGQDWYSASAIYSVLKTFTLVVPFTGYHKIVATVNGKHASSSNYYYAVSEVNIYPTAY